MKKITFFDLEVSLETKKIVDYGAIKSNDEKIHDSSLSSFTSFIGDTKFICGHNIVDHDLKHLFSILGEKEYAKLIDNKYAIDTLYFSALFFPQRQFHNLLKDDKLISDELNNPLSDAIKARDLFYSEVDKFALLPDQLKQIYYTLLKDHKGFGGFFKYVDFSNETTTIDEEIKSFFKGKICENIDLKKMINEYPIELAYCLALIFADDDYSISPGWILKHYPHVNNLIHLLRGTPCLTGCSYCNEKLNIYKGLKNFFGYDKFREFKGEALQERAVQAAVNNKSLLVVFPTGGGKSITFQLPALMAAKNTKGISVVISPLQSLMKDQVDNLRNNSINDAVTINGLLDPLERAQSIESIREGKAFILYISPESLRSKTIENLLLNRNINRFIIDEAHCFSSWGHDFRVDYLYIGDFIRNICLKKNLEEPIPVSCFTATAKRNVIDDIVNYFKDKLGLELELFTTNSSRENLSYKVIRTEEENKYSVIRELLNIKKCPTIIYVSRTKKAEELCNRLNHDGFFASTFHGKMDKKEKSENQDAFIKGDVDIMVATSAFGMGVDKKDVGLVIHYDISDSLENYMQEAGRAGRDQNISADCYILFNEEDLNKHFMLLNQTKLTMQEIQQIWRAIKDITKKRSRMSNSALEIAREAGWDDNLKDIETRVTTAIAALEDAGYIKRGQNSPRIFANSIRAKSVIEANKKIEESKLFNPSEEINAKRIIAKLISSRSRKQFTEDYPESRIDYISDDLGIKKEEVIYIVQLLREAKVLADAKDLTAYVDDNNSMINNFHKFKKLEKFLLEYIPDEKSVQNIKELNEQAEQAGIDKISTKHIKKILNYWDIKNIIKQELSPYSKNYLVIYFLKDKEILDKDFTKRFDVAEFILSYLKDKYINDEKEFSFSVLELQEEYNLRMQLLGQTTNINEVEETLLYLSKIGSLKLEGGFIVSLNSLNIERLEKDNKVRYKVEDYKNLKRYYEQKTQMIHIVGEYAKKMMEDYNAAIQFVEDYFTLEYSSFLRKYFKGSKENEIVRNMTPEKFKKLFGDLSVKQLNIINDNTSQYIVVAAGPGSGKTRVLVHKLASLLLMEDIKPEQLLMLTFSRAAATEFKKRLISLIGNTAYWVDIKTFHSYCFDSLGKVGDLEKSDKIIEEAIMKIQNDEIDPSIITKSVIVIDEAQDMDEYEFKLIQTLIDKNDDVRVIAVGDDDQNIYSFRGSNSKYMLELLNKEKSKMYELVNNYRSKANLVDFTNAFVETINGRIKKMSIIANQNDNGKIEIYEYPSNNMILPAINKLIDDGVKGSTCILTLRNEEAYQAASFLQKNKIRAKLIQDNGKYNLYDLIEFRYFLNELKLPKEAYTIPEENWAEAKRKLKEKYYNSNNYYLCEKLIKDFEEITNKYMYKSDFITFLRESKEEDFYDKNEGYVIVSTIHKSKGWEFDHVIMILNGENYKLDNELKRAIYVGMTRAKECLTIHFNNNFLDINQNIHYEMIKDLTYTKNTTEYEPTNSIIKQLSFKDVYLSYFNDNYIQNYIGNLKSGDSLIVDEYGCLDQHDNRILKFSKKFMDELNKLLWNGYEIVNASVKYLIYWKEREAENEILVLLPEIELTKY